MRNHTRYAHLSLHSYSLNLTNYSKSQIALRMYWGRPYVVTHMVFLHWLTRVSLSSSLCGLTVISSKVLGRAQNSRLAGSTLRLVQLAKLIRPIGFYTKQVMDLITYNSDMSNILMKSHYVFLPCAFHHQDMSNRRCSTLREHTISYARPQSHWHLQTWSINCDRCQYKLCYYVKAIIWLTKNCHLVVHMEENTNQKSLILYMWVDLTLHPEVNMAFQRTEKRHLDVWR